MNPMSEGTSESRGLRAARWLTWLLRATAVVMAFALVAVFMPREWLARVHETMGLGELPSSPLTEYLARALSAFYASLAGLLWVFASDIQRYRVALRYLATAWLSFSILSLVFAITAGESFLSWFGGDAVLAIALNAAILWLLALSRQEGA